jgi:hypothetical protein
MVRYRSPAPLSASHRTERYVCRSEEQTHWLKQRARQSTSANSTRVFVVTDHESEDVLAYYAWCMASLALQDAPARAHGREPAGIRSRSRCWRDWEFTSTTKGAGSGRACSPTASRAS